MIKLIGCYLMGNCENFVDLTLSSIWDYVDKIVIVYDTTSKDSTYKKIKEWEEKLKDKLIILERPFEHSSEIKYANSNARNFYLQYLKENYKDTFVLVLDSDEIPDENISKLKEFISTLDTNKNYLFSIRMRHLVHSLRHEDATSIIHFVSNRLFNIRETLEYPNGEHPVLSDKYECIIGQINFMTLWHMAYTMELFDLKKKYDNHRNKSEIHSQQFLRNWYFNLIFNKYPVKEFDPTELPKIIKENFEIIDDELYFEDRKQLELKHFIDVIQWKNYFQLTPDKKVLDIGCGFGHRVLAGLNIGLDIWGFDKSMYIIEYPVYPDLVKKFPEPSRLTWGDIVKPIINKLIPKTYDFIVCYDILEHLEHNELERAITHLIQFGNEKAKYLISVPVQGDPNLLKDKTHKIRETKEWWHKKFEERGFNLLPVPSWFNFAHQLIILEKK